MSNAPAHSGQLNRGHWASRFDENLDRFAFAADRAGGITERCFSIGGRRVILRFAGPALIEPVTRALAHLGCPPGAGAEDPPLTVMLWDEASTGVGVAGLRRDTDTPSMELFRRPGMVGLHQPVERILCVLDQSRDTALWWTPDALTLPYWERGAPLLRLLHWWMPRHGCQVVHGAAVGTAHGGVLLVGPSGSGKSSTALASLQGGLHYVGDDYVLMELGPPATAYSLYNSAKLHPEQATRFPALLEGPGAPDEEKVLAFMHERRPEQLALSVPLVAVLAPVVVPSTRTTVAPLPRAQALAALAPSTILQLHGGDDTLARLAALLRAVPCYRISLGSDMEAIAHVIAGLIEDLRPR